MNPTVWRYDLSCELGHPFTVAAPTGAMIVHFGIHDDRMAIWVQHNQPGTTEGLRLIVVGTGMELPSDDWYHAGTIFVGAYVWHLYEGFEEDS